MVSIPIKLHTPDAVFTEAAGLVKLERGRLIIEFETKDAFFGVYRSGVQEIAVLPDDITSIDFKRNLFKAELRIRAHSMKTFDQVPGSKLGEIRLRFRRAHRAEAQELAAFLQHRLSELAQATTGDSTPIEP